MRIGDWSSDVCSSDLIDQRSAHAADQGGVGPLGRAPAAQDAGIARSEGEGGDVDGDVGAGFIDRADDTERHADLRSEESRAGKECVSTGRSRWVPAY